MGGLITFIVHTIVQGWVGVLVSLLVMIPVLRGLAGPGVGHRRAAERDVFDDSRLHRTGLELRL